MLQRWVRLRVRLIWPEVVAVQVCLLFAAAWRGLDYLTPPDPASSALSVIEKTAPMTIWGILFLSGGLIGLIGLRFDRWPLAAAGHVLAIAGYGAFAVGSAIEVFGRSPVEGWRTPVDWLMFAIIHWAFADASVDVWRERRTNAD
ncbi:hypothetical protein [Gordonia sp. SND2]|uniref:hypothetical protein n=1 Tax=Gordonia sp. SND2 TaxID=3388659 RepID=UPI00398B1FFF